MLVTVHQSLLQTLCELLDSYGKVRKALNVDIHIPNVNGYTYFDCIYCIFVSHEFPRWSAVEIYSHVYAVQMWVLAGCETRGSRHNQAEVRA